MYVGDCSTFRNTMFRDYEKFPYGSFEGTLNSTSKNCNNLSQGNYLFLNLNITFRHKH